MLILIVVLLFDTNSFILNINIKINNETTNNMTSSPRWREKVRVCYIVITNIDTTWTIVTSLLIVLITTLDTVVAHAAV